MGVVETRDHPFERLTVDEPHRIKRPIIAISSERVDRRDIGVFATTGDLGLSDEPGPATLMLNVFGPDPLKCDHAIQLLIMSDEDLAQPPLGVWPDDAKPPRALVSSSPSQYGFENLGFGGVGKQSTVVVEVMCLSVLLTHLGSSIAKSIEAEPRPHGRVDAAHLPPFHVIKNRGPGVSPPFALRIRCRPRSLHSMSDGDSDSSVGG